MVRHHHMLRNASLNPKVLKISLHPVVKKILLTLEDLVDNWPSDNQASIHHEQPAVQWPASADKNLPKINQPGQTITRAPVNVFLCEIKVKSAGFF